jgi:hypothetical protein
LAVLWEQRDRLFEVDRRALLAEIRDRKVEQRTSYAATGPTMTFADDQALYAYLARLWRDSSLQMKLLCDANGIAYAHFLQPNQHVAGSKPLAPEELRLATGGPYHTPVVRGYPLLRQYGEELRSAGVRFRDLTMVFKDVQGPVYNDGCCHVTPAGYVMVARAIGEALDGGAGGEASPSADGPAPP